MPGHSVHIMEVSVFRDGGYLNPIISEPNCLLYVYGVVGILEVCYVRINLTVLIVKFRQNSPILLLSPLLFNKVFNSKINLVNYYIT